jgi:hypothetical protein
MNGPEHGASETAWALELGKSSNIGKPIFDSDQSAKFTRECTSAFDRPFCATISQKSVGKYEAGTRVQEVTNKLTVVYAGFAIPRWLEVRATNPRHQDFLLLNGAGSPSRREKSPDGFHSDT